MSTAVVSAPAGTKVLANTKVLAGTKARVGVEAVVAAPTRLRLTRRGRLVLTTLASVPLILAAALFALNGGGAFATGDEANTPFHYVTIHSGGSLWQVAEEVAPRADPRDVVSQIVDLNQLETATVMPGQRIAIPHEYR